MITEHQTYMGFELMFMCVIMPIDARRNLTLVSREMAAIVRPHLFNSIRVVVKPRKPLQLREQELEANIAVRPEDALELREEHELDVKLSPKDEFQETLASPAVWRHSIHIRKLVMIVQMYRPNSWHAIDPQPYPTVQAAFIINACKNLRTLDLVVSQTEESGCDLGPGIHPILEAIASINTIRVHNFSGLFSGAQREATERASVGMSELWLTRVVCPAGEEEDNFIQWIVSGAAATLNTLHLSPYGPLTEEGTYPEASYRMMERMLRQCICPALRALTVIDSKDVHTLAEFMENHPDIDQLRVVASQPPNLSSSSALSKIAVMGIDIPVGSIAASLSSLSDPAMMRELIIMTASCSSGIPHFLRALSPLRLLENLQVSLISPDNKYSQPNDLENHDWFSVLHSMPRLQAAHISGPLPFHLDLPAIPVPDASISDDTGKVYATSLISWAKSLRSRLILLIVKLASGVPTLRQIHWEPIYGERIGDIPDIDPAVPVTSVAQIIAAPLLYWNVHMDFIIARAHSGRVRRVCGGFRRLGPKDSNKPARDQDLKFPKSRFQYAVPWRLQDMETNSEANEGQT